jgi:hypothetical protein
LRKRILTIRGGLALTTFIALCPLAICAEPSANWVRVGTHHPSARVNMAMGYDAAGRNIVLFGGYDGTAYRNDTWIFNGSDWVQLNPPVSPSPRTASGMAFDKRIGKMVMFGGFDGSQYLGDTWIWDGTVQTWTQANPTTLPTPVTLPMAFTDPLSGHASMVGGYDGFLFQNITWQWTGTNWRARNPATWITARGAAIVANDYGHGKVVIFGGLADLNPNNTWTWDGVTWTLENPSSQPPWTFYSSAAYDPRLGEVVTFGGSSGVNLTWAWTGSDWVAVSTPRSPTGRDSEAMAYDFATDQLIMFGGENRHMFLDGTYQLLVH